MAGTVAEVDERLQKVDERVQKVEAAVNTTNGGIGTLKFLLTLVASIAGAIIAVSITLGVTGFVSLHNSIGELKTTGTEVKTALTFIKDQHKADVERLDKSDEKLETRMEKRLTEIAASAKVAQVFHPTAKEWEGKIVRVDMDHLTLTPLAGPPVYTELTFRLAESPRIVVNGKVVQLADLKPGMNVHITCDDNSKVELVKTINLVPQIKIPREPTGKPE